MLPLAHNLLPRVEAALVAASVVPLIFFAVMLRQTLSHPSKIDVSGSAATEFLGFDL
jgi:hypothetical protein